MRHAFAILLVVTVVASADGPKKRSAGEAPAIELVDAIGRARAYATTAHIDVAKQYLQSASFDPVDRRWDIVWQLANAKGGRTEIHISETGSGSASFGE